MNGTIIDIPGINVNVNPISLEDSSDKAYVITFKDEHGHNLKIETAFGKITNVSYAKNCSNKQ